MDFMKMMQQAQQMQGRMQELQAGLEREVVSAASGGGMVRVEADGKGAIRSVKIDASVVNPADVEMLEDLVLVAITEAQKKAQDVQAREMGKLTGGLDLPFKLPF